MVDLAFDWLGMWNMLLGGNIFQAMISSYTNVLGVWFYTLVIFLGMMMIYFKTRNFGTTIITGILVIAGSYSSIALGMATAIIPTEAMFPIMIVIALGITVILYRVFH
jgi:hypothetical protein